MQSVVVASTNPTKLRAVKSGFARMFPDDMFEFRNIEVVSGVRAQPLTRDETLQGATNRIAHAQLMVPDADFYVGLESGIQEDEYGMASYSWVLISSAGYTGRAQTAVWYLPPPIAADMRSGVELGHACDRLFGTSHSKSKNGAVGLLTGDAIDRETSFSNAVVLALIPFRSCKMYGIGPDTTAISK